MLKVFALVVVGLVLVACGGPAFESAGVVGGTGAGETGCSSRVTISPPIAGGKFSCREGSTLNVGEPDGIGGLFLDLPPGVYTFECDVSVVECNGDCVTMTKSCGPFTTEVLACGVPVFHSC